MSGFEALRREYADRDLAALGDDPVAALAAWIAEADTSGVREPHAMVLATADAGGRPNARTVLLKTLDDRGLSFVTNLGSAKSQELAANPNATALFVWIEMERQVRVTGAVTMISDEEADAFFAARPRQAQLAAWASPQSEVIADREWLQAAVVAAEARFTDGAVPRPPQWGGWRLHPDTIEFWQGRAHRLHERLRYTRSDSGWRTDRLAP